VRAHRDARIRPSIVGVRGRPMKDGEKTVLLSPAAPRLCIKREALGAASAGEPVVSIVHFIGGRTLYFESGIIFLVLHPRAYSRVCERRARKCARSSVQFDFVSPHPATLRCDESRNYARYACVTRSSASLIISTASCEGIPMSPRLKRCSS